MGIRVQVSDDHTSIRGEVEVGEGGVEGGVVYHVEGRGEVYDECKDVLTCKSGVLQGTGEELELLDAIPALSESCLLGGEEVVFFSIVTEDSLLEFCPKLVDGVE